MAVSKDEVKKLAELSRLELTDAEVEVLQGEIDSIVQYIDRIQEVPLPDEVVSSPHLDKENVMREDKNPHEPGEYTEKLLGQAPHRDGEFLKVKKILG